MATRWRLILKVWKWASCDSGREWDRVWKETQTRERRESCRRRRFARRAQKDRLLRLRVYNASDDARHDQENDDEDDPHLDVLPPHLAANACRLLLELPSSDLQVFRPLVQVLELCVAFQNVVDVLAHNACDFVHLGLDFVQSLTARHDCRWLAFPVSSTTTSNVLPTVNALPRKLRLSRSNSKIPNEFCQRTPAKQFLFSAEKGSPGQMSFEQQKWLLPLGSAKAVTCSSGWGDDKVLSRFFLFLSLGDLVLSLIAMPFCTDTRMSLPHSRQSWSPGWDHDSRQRLRVCTCMPELELVLTKKSENHRKWGYTIWHDRVVPTLTRGCRSIQVQVFFVFVFDILVHARLPDSSSTCWSLKIMNDHQRMFNNV